jgi:hypothetical protein
VQSSNSRRWLWPALVHGSRFRAQAEFMPLMYGDESVGVVATGSLPYEKQSMLERIERMQPL